MIKRVVRRDQFRHGPTLVKLLKTGDEQKLQGGVGQQKHGHRNTDSKIGPGGREKQPENRGKTTKHHENPQKLRERAPT